MLMGGVLGGRGRGGEGEKEERILRTYMRGQVLFLLYPDPSVIIPPIMPLPQHILHAATISTSSFAFSSCPIPGSGKCEDDGKRNQDARTHHTMQPVKHAQPPQIPPSSLFCQRNRVLVVAP